MLDVVVKEILKEVKYVPTIKKYLISVGALEAKATRLPSKMAQ